MNRILTIREYQEIEDPQALLRLIRRQMEVIGRDPEAPSLEQSLKNALKPESRALLFLSCSDDNIIQAFAFANVCSGLESGADYLWLNEIFVDAPFRYNHLATELLSYLEQWAKEKDIRYLACITGEKNVPAIRCYEKNQFDVNPVLWVDKTLK